MRASLFLPQLGTIRRFANADAALLSCSDWLHQKACMPTRRAVRRSVLKAPRNFTAASGWRAVFHAIKFIAIFRLYRYGDRDGGVFAGHQLPGDLCFYFAANISTSGTPIQSFSLLWDYPYIPLGTAGRPGSPTQHPDPMLLGGPPARGRGLQIWGGLHGAAPIVHRALTQRRGVARREEMQKHASERTRPLWVVGLAPDRLLWRGGYFLRAPDLPHAVPALRSFHFCAAVARDRSFDALDRGPTGFVLWLNFGAYSRPGGARCWHLPLDTVARSPVLYHPPHYAPFIYFQF